MVTSRSGRFCDDTDLVTNLVTEAQKRRSPHGAGFVMGYEPRNIDAYLYRFRKTAKGLNRSRP